MAIERECELFPSGAICACGVPYLSETKHARKLMSVASTWLPKGGQNEKQICFSLGKIRVKCTVQELLDLVVCCTLNWLATLKLSRCF